MVLKSEEYRSQINLRFTIADLLMWNWDWDLEPGKDPSVLRTSPQGENPESLNSDVDWGF